MLQPEEKTIKLHKSHTMQPEVTYYDCDIQKVVNRLYIGDELVANNKKLLKDLSITHIVTVGLQLKPLHPGSFQYLLIPVRDYRKENLTKYFEITNSFIENALILPSNGVLVHCAKGISRSATVVLAFLMHKYKMKYLDALGFLRRKRKQISPNQGFMVQLQKYEEILLKKAPE